MLLDLIDRMSDVELMGELRGIAGRADERGEDGTATQASELFTVFYACRLRAQVPAWLWEATRTFVRQHAG